MDTLPEIEAAVDALPVTQQKQLLRHLSERFQEQEEPRRRLPLVRPQEILLPNKTLTMPTEALLDVNIVSCPCDRSCARVIFHQAIAF